MWFRTCPEKDPILELVEIEEVDLDPLDTSLEHLRDHYIHDVHNARYALQRRKEHNAQQPARVTNPLSWHAERASAR